MANGFGAVETFAAVLPSPACPKTRLGAGRRQCADFAADYPNSPPRQTWYTVCFAEGTPVRIDVLRCRMSCRSVLLLGVVVVGVSSIGCAGGSAARSVANLAERWMATPARAMEPRAPRSSRVRSPRRPPARASQTRHSGRSAGLRPRPLLERARIDATASIARFIRPNEAITHGVFPGRLNLYLDEQRRRAQRRLRVSPRPGPLYGREGIPGRPGDN